MPVTGGEGQERKISSFGYDPQWSPDGSQILFQASGFASTNSFYVEAWMMDRRNRCWENSSPNMSSTRQPPPVSRWEEDLAFDMEYNRDS